jgi:hypothetical protein
MKRFPKVYLDDVADCQSVLFILVNKSGYNFVDFINFYMKSKLRHLIDDGQAVYCNYLGTELLDFLKEKEKLDKHVKKSNDIVDEFKAEWIGYFYALSQWYSGIESKDLLDYIDPDELLAKYNVLHDMDILIAIQKWFSFRGVAIDINM